MSITEEGGEAHKERSNAEEEKVEKHTRKGATQKKEEKHTRKGASQKKEEKHTRKGATQKKGEKHMMKGVTEKKTRRRSTQMREKVDMRGEAHKRECTRKHGAGKGTRVRESSLEQVEEK
ncbi:hypothetical protein NDU88_006976 [Pleurodeles waltl]|uniref:Uncharacterized protein n=1 Tax=Pleurodeles waltl TaxID=8319 RepID=A0AAV7WE30_PLEWA|nr:hypothetical protein NDU88_006976 [Pleurodeles waltl]